MRSSADGLTRFWNACSSAALAVHVGGTRAQRPRQEQRVGGLVELQAAPVRHPVNPLVLGPVAVRLLRRRRGRRAFVGPSPRRPARRMPRPTRRGRATRPGGSHRGRCGVLPQGIDRLATVAPGRVRSWCDRSTVAEVRYRSRSCADSSAGGSTTVPTNPCQLPTYSSQASWKGPASAADASSPASSGRVPNARASLGHAVVERELGHARDVAGGGACVGPRHPAVRREVLPAIRCAHVADTLARRGRLGCQGQGPRPVLREEHGTALVRCRPTRGREGR